MILAIVGPTGVGKTKLSEELAVKYNAIIINADAVQIYKELDIGSAKPKKEEMSNAKHYLFDKVSIKDDYNVMNYQKDVRKLLSENKDKNIIFVGGTGLYLSAALYNYEFFDEVTISDFDNLTNEELYKLALEKDENIDIHENNRVRLLRFLNKDTISTKAKELLYDVKFIGLTTERSHLYEIINSRVDCMINEGLVNEVTDLKKYEECSRVLNSAIGYKELLLYLNGEISLEESIELIKKNSRNYAKRQYTWFNNKMNVEWFNVDYDNFNNTINEVIKYIELKKN